MSDKKNVQGPNEAATPDAGEAASVSERIDSLRKTASEGALGDELLEEVAGGHTDGVTHTDGAHTDGVTHTDSATPVGGFQT